MNSTDLLPLEIIEDDPLLDFAAQLEQSARALDLEDWIVQRLKLPERELTVHLSLRRDSADAMSVAPPLSGAGFAGQDGDVRGAYPCASLAIAGLRVQHYRPRAGCIGPVLLTPDTHIKQLRPLALQMTLQCALLDLPLGGSAGAIVCDPAQLTERELRHLVRHYLATLDTRGDIFAPTEFAAAWTAAGRHLGNGALVGKPAILDGLPDLTSAIAAGWFTLISEVLHAGVPRPSPGLARACPELVEGAGILPEGSPDTSHQPLATRRIALQGFSPAAMTLATVLHGAGARIVALADKSGGLLAERGLDLAAISAHVAASGMIYGCDAAELVSNTDVLESACDVLITAAAERQVNAQNAARIRASLVLEAVPNAVTPAAASALSARGITVIPALLGAAPRTLAWFAEWQQGLHFSAPEQEATESFIRRKLAGVFRRVHASAIANQLSLPQACRLLALDKLSARWRLTS